MKAPAVLMNDRARPFAVDELFFSTTDARGIITSGNEVFVRISGYPVSALVGHAHNIVRHPDMPRAAFRLVWQRLKAGQAVAALVKNLANDGCHYWVVALITPMHDGYLSVRFKPTSPLLAVVEALYGRMRAAEVAVEERGGNGDAAMAAGAAVLAEGLKELGFADYESFMHELLCAEVKSRDATLAGQGRTIVHPLADVLAVRLAREPELKCLAEIHRHGCHAYGHLNLLYRRLDEFVALNQTLRDKSSFVNSLTDELRLSSVNVALASTRLGGEGESLGVISRHMDETSGEVAAAVHELVTGINTLSERLRGVTFNLASARLQMEMVLTFVGELAAANPEGARPEGRRERIRMLQVAFSAALAQAGASLRDLEGAVQPLGAWADCLGRHMLTLRTTQVGGFVECTRVAAQGSFRELFVQIREQVERTHGELTELTAALHTLHRLAHETPALAQAIEFAAGRMERNIETLPADRAVAVPTERLGAKAEVLELAPG